MPGGNFNTAAKWLLRHFGRAETEKVVSLTELLDQKTFEGKELPRNAEEARETAEREKFWVCPSCHGEGVIRRLPAPPWEEGEKVA